MKIIKDNTSSPFLLRRSMVPQNEGGAYQTGGYDPNSYDASSDIMTASLEGFSKTIGAALGSITKSDVNKMNVKGNERRNKRVENIDKKISKETNRMTDSGIAEVGTKKSKKLEERKEKIQGRINKADEEIKKYEAVYGKNTSNDFLDKQRKGY
jgi:hypothetical protein